MHRYGHLGRTLFGKRRFCVQKSLKVGKFQQNYVFSSEKSWSSSGVFSECALRKHSSRKRLFWSLKIRLVVCDQQTTNNEQVQKGVGISFFFFFFFAKNKAVKENGKNRRKKKPKKSGNLDTLRFTFCVVGTLPTSCAHSCSRNRK